MKPENILKTIHNLLPWCAGSCAASFAIGLWLALWQSPPDYQMGDVVRIMYVHVPAAWLSLGIYSVMALLSALAIIFRWPLAALGANAAAPIGAGFTFLALITGSIWGKPMWGAWWVWDARLTSMLVLFFLYVGYMLIIATADNRETNVRSANIFAIVGFVNIPIIKFSVDWWNTLHQPASILKFSKPSIDLSMLWPLGVMALAFALLFITLLLARLEIEILSRKIQRLTIQKIYGFSNG